MQSVSPLQDKFSPIFGPAQRETTSFFCIFLPELYNSLKRKMTGSSQLLSLEAFCKGAFAQTLLFDPQDSVRKDSERESIHRPPDIIVSFLSFTQLFPLNKSFTALLLGIPNGIPSWNSYCRTVGLPETPPSKDVLMFGSLNEAFPFCSF